jgi:hypothetical protein
MNIEKSKIELCTYTLMTFTLMLTGCQTQQPYHMVEQVCVPQVNAKEIMHVAEDVLTNMHFAIDKADSNIGLIKTRPLPGAQFFEFWRNDNIGAFNTVEANLHTIRRIAQLSLSQQGEQMCINCVVQTYKLNLPEHEIASTAQAYQMFSKSTPSMQKLELNPEQQKDMSWIYLGKDPRLATEILILIEKQLTKSNACSASNINNELENIGQES